MTFLSDIAGGIIDLLSGNVSNLPDDAKKTIGDVEDTIDDIFKPKKKSKIKGNDFLHEILNSLLDTIDDIDVLINLSSAYVALGLKTGSVLLLYRITDKYIRK